MRRFISVILIILIIMSVVPVFAGIEMTVERGTCGNSANWTFCETNDGGTLTISGNGEMYDYEKKKEYASSYSTNKISFRSTAPWAQYNSRVTEIIVEEGITYLGEYAFYNTKFLDSVVKLTLPESLTKIGKCALFCLGDKTHLPSKIAYIPDYFYSSSELSSMKVPKSITEIRDYAFYDCSNLESIYLPSDLSYIGVRAFYNCINLKNVYYEGNQSQWKSVKIKADNEWLTKVDIHFNSFYEEPYYYDLEPEKILEEDIFLEETCKLDVDISVSDINDFELNKVIYDVDNESYDIDIIKLNICVTNENFLASIKAQNVNVKICLPKGFSFEKNSDITEKSLYFDFISTDKKFSEIVYLIDTPYNDSHTITVETSGDNTENEGFFTHNLMVGTNIFDLEKYKADHIIYNSDLADIIERNFCGDTPATSLKKSAEKAGLDLSVNFWKAVKDTGKIKDNPANITDIVFEKKDMYEAILWDVFETSCNSDLIDSLQSTVNESSKSAYDSIVKYFKTAYNIDLAQSSSFSGLTDLQKKEFLEKMDEKFAKNFPGLGEIERFSKFIGDISKSISDIYTVCKASASYYMLYSLNDSVKSVMREMYSQCDGNILLESALLNCLEVMESDEIELSANIAAMSILNGGKFAFKACVDEMWSKAKSKFCAIHPVAAVYMAAYEAGVYISDTLFNVSETTEKYAIVEAVADVKDLSLTAYNNRKKLYKNSGTESNAKIYNTSIDIMYNVLNADCEASAAFADSYIQSEYAKILGEKTPEEKKRQIENIRSSYSEQYETVHNSWVHQLREDYPKQYEKYKHLISDYDTDNIAQKYEISCPVDVYVCDLRGNTIGSVVNNIVYVSDAANIAVGAAGDKKIIYLDDEKYNLKYVGNSIGEMDVKITVFDDTEIERKIYFENIPLTSGKIYTSSNYYDEYFLETSDKKIEPDYDTDENAENVVFYEYSGEIQNTDDIKKDDTELFSKELCLYIGKTKYYKNGMKGKNDVAPVIINNRTLLPVRLIAETFDCMVSWDEETRTVSIYYDGEKEKDSELFLELPIGENEIKKIYFDYEKIYSEFSEVEFSNELEGLYGLGMEKILPFIESSYITLDSPAVIMNNRTYVPVRAVSEALNINVEWDEVNQMVKLSKKELGTFYKNYPDVLNLAYYLMDSPIMSNETSCRYDVRDIDCNKVLNIISKYVDSMKTNGWSVKEDGTAVFALYTLQKDGKVIKLNFDGGAFIDFESE